MGLHDRLRTSNGNGPVAAAELAGHPSGEVAQDSAAHDPYSELKTRIHHACIATLGAELFKREATGDLTERVTRAVTEQLVLDRTPLTRDERRKIIREITDDILGYGPLEPFLRDDSVTEVMVNNFDQIYVEQLGKIERTSAAFADNAHLLRIIDKIVSQVGRRVDESSPMVDARLPDGSRVNAIIPPLALRGPTLTIREQIASAFALLVQISRLVGGSRRITHITEVLRMESDVITLQDIFLAKPPDEEAAAESRATRLLGPLTCTGLKPGFLEKMAANGVVLPPSFFTHDEGEAV